MSIFLDQIINSPLQQMLSILTSAIAKAFAIDLVQGLFFMLPVDIYIKNKVCAFILVSRLLAMIYAHTVAR